MKSQGFFFYLADHPDDEKLHSNGQQEMAYRNFLDWLGGTLSEEIGILFNPNDSANRIYPPQRVLDELLVLINDSALKDIWSQDETIGWIYQYFTPKELRDKARKESQAPRNSYELAFRNQFFTPRYVVEFLTDNTLGRIWYEMRRGNTVLKDRCRYLIRRSTEIFLNEGEASPADRKNLHGVLSQQELLEQPVYILHRAKKDPREIKILDPACGSGHFLLYCFDLLHLIYIEAYDDPNLDAELRKEYPALEDLQRDVPGLILKHNLHGIDIDLRATQIAALALWLRCQRTYLELGLVNKERPNITRSKIVCAEPMPGEVDLLKEFTTTLQPKILGQLVEAVFEKMKIAGEAGSLLKIEKEIRDAASTAKNEYLEELLRRKEQAGYLPGMAPKKERALFDFSDMTDSEFFDRAEEEIVAALRQYAENVSNGRVFRRRLFAEDAARGFSFVDVCRGRYDVVLMNPPFGSISEGAKTYIFSKFDREKIELGACFITLMSERILRDCGTLGIIANRNILFAGSLGEWRQRCLDKLGECADLGHGVLDALVETAAFVIRPTSQPIFFIKLLDSMAKSEDLANQCMETGGFRNERFFIRNFESFNAIEGAPFAYWLPLRFLENIGRSAKAEDLGIIARAGLQTCDNFRFLRLAWEIQPKELAGWIRLTKGGEYQPFWGDIPLLLNWGTDGEELKTFIESIYSQWSKQIPSSDLYGHPGSTYSERTTSGLSLRVLPANCVFDKVGPFVGFRSNLFNQDTILSFIGLSFTSPIRALVESAVGLREATESGSPARHYLASMVQRLPLPLGNSTETHKLGVSVYKIAESQRLIQSFEEPNSFWIPAVVWHDFDSLHDVLRAKQKAIFDLLEVVYDEFIPIEQYCIKTLGLDDESVTTVREISGMEFVTYPDDMSSECEDAVKNICLLEDDKLVDEVSKRIGGRASILKKSYVGDRRVELLSVYTRRSPKAIIKFRTRIICKRSKKRLGTS